MLAQFSVHFIFIIISTLIPLITGDCITDTDKCIDKFKSDLENQMKQQLDSAQNQLSQICHPIDGSFNQFVNCINGVDSECHSDKRFRPNLCDKRYFKTRISKFIWKASFFYQLCHNTTPEWSQGFLKHEDCINGIFTDTKWKCLSYERVVKSKKDWKTDHDTTCSLWQKFRDCSKRDINQKCGTDASLISDHLFHSHQSYFEKYYSCNFESSKFSDQCWLDLIAPKDTNTQTLISSTAQPTNDMTDNNIDSNKSQNSMAINDNTSQTSDTDLNVQTLKDTTDPQPDENHEQAWVKTEQNRSLNHELEGQESNQMIATDANETHDLKANAMKESNGKNTEQLTAASGASTDSIADKYLLVIPIVIVFSLSYKFK